MVNVDSPFTEVSHLLQTNINDENDLKPNMGRRLWLNKVTWGLVGTAAGVLFMHLLTQAHMEKDMTNSGRPSNDVGGGRVADIESSSTSVAAAVSSSPYNKFQPLGFQVYTGGAPAFVTETDDSGNERVVPNYECEGMNSFGLSGGEIQCYVGQEDTMLDIEQRLMIMTDAVERAYEFSDKDPQTLKIFLAPEFFFRSKDGAYVYNLDDEDADIDDDDCKEICHILAGLEQLVAQKRFEDWLFLFGTVVVSEVLPQEDQWDYLFYNFAPIYKGYDPTKTDFHGKRFIVPKRYVSNMDFLTPARHFNDSLAKELVQFGPPQTDKNEDTRTVLNPYDIHRKKYDRKLWYRYKSDFDHFGYTMIEYDWLIVDGITFTIEVCLDHDLKTALNAYMADAVLGSTTRIPSSYTHRATGATDLEFVSIPQRQAQVSLVSSAGMTVNADSLALTNGGTIILQDGMNNNDASMEWTDECQQYSWHFEGGSEAIQRFGVMSPTEVLFQYEVNKAYVKHELYDPEERGNWESFVEGVFTTMQYPPKVTVYEPKLLVAV